MQKIIVIMVVFVGFCISFGEYSAYWSELHYPDELVDFLSSVSNGEVFTENLRTYDSPEAIFEMGRLYYARGLYRQALAFFNRTDCCGDLRLLYIGLCNIVLDNPDSAKIVLSKINEPSLRPWSSAAIAYITGNTPSVVDDYPYLRNFFIKESVSSANRKGFTLQFGAFADSSRAENLAQTLKDIGLSPYIVKVEIGGRTLFRVRAEHFDTKEKAQEAGSALGDQFIFMVVPEE